MHGMHETTWNGTCHQLNKHGEHSQFIREWCGSAIEFSIDVTNAGPPLCTQGCRSIEIIIVMWSFISQRAPSSLILFYSQHRDLTGGGGWGGGLRRARVWLDLLFSECMGIICSNCFHGFWWLPLSCRGSKVVRYLADFILGIFCRWISLRLIHHCWFLTQSPLCGTYSNVSSLAKREAS